MNNARADWADDQSTCCGTAQGSPRNSIIQEIEDRARARVLAQRLNDQQIALERAASRAAERATHDRIISETREIIARNRRTLESTAQTLENIRGTLDDTRSLENRYLQFKQTFDEVIRKAVEGLSDSMGLEDVQQMKAEFGSPQQKSIEECADILKNHQSIVFMTGHDISSAKLNRTDLEVGGTTYSIQNIFTIDFMNEHPQAFWQRTREYIKAAKLAKPGPEHIAIQQFAIKHPEKTVKIVTLSADGMEFGPVIYRLHGNIKQLLCMADCGQIDIEEFEGIPNCPHCGGAVRPNVCFFNEHYTEALHSIESIKAALNDCEALVVVGTDLQLMGPRTMVRSYAKAGKTIFDISDEPVIHYGQVFATHNRQVLPQILNLI